MANSYFTGKIHTGLYGADAWQFVQNFIFASHNRYIFGRAWRSSDYMDASLNSENEVIIDVRPADGYYDRYHRHSIFRKASDAKGVLRELAYMIKKYMYYTFGNEYVDIEGDCRGMSKNDYIRTKWTHKNTDVVETLGGPVRETFEYTRFFKNPAHMGHIRPKAEFAVTVAEVNYVYTLFRDFSRNHTNKFSKKIVDRFTSAKFDPLQSEMEACRRQEYQRIYDEFEAKITDATPEFSCSAHTQSAAYLELQSIIKDFKAKQEQVIADLKSQRDAAFKELSDSLSFLTNI